MILVKNNKITKIFIKNKLINEVKINRFSVFYYFTFKPLLKEFLNNFKEFKPLFKSKQDIKYFYNTLNKIKCFNREFDNLNDNNIDKFKHNINNFFLLIAHQLTMDGFAKNIGILPSDGLIASSSVGDVSISFQANPYGKNEFSYWLSLTPYGRAYLACLARRTGILIVN